MFFFLIIISLHSKIALNYYRVSEDDLIIIKERGNIYLNLD